MVVIDWIGRLMWILVSLAAGSLQTARNGLARSLSRQLPAVLLSWARFAFNLPFAVTLLAVLALVSELPALSSAFLFFCLIAGVAQLVANVALVTSFRMATFAQAIVIHKSEVALTAVVGAVVFAEVPSALGWLGVAATMIGVAMIALTGRPGTAGLERSVGRSGTAGFERLGGRSGTARFECSAGQSGIAGFDRSADWRSVLAANRGSALALFAAALLVVAAFSIKEATQELEAVNPQLDSVFPLAATALFHVTWMEVVILTVWILATNPSRFGLVPAHRGRLAAIGFTGFAGSLAWFWAFSLTLVAYVRAVGQVEAVLSVLLALYVWHEHQARRQLPGIAVTMIGILLIVLG